MDYKKGRTEERNYFRVKRERVRKGQTTLGRREETWERMRGRDWKETKRLQL
jgi:hypothetical protein